MYMCTCFLTRELTSMLRDFKLSILFSIPGCNNFSLLLLHKTEDEEFPQWRHKNEGWGEEEWEGKPIKKEMDNTSFLWRNMLIFWGTFFIFKISLTTESIWCCLLFTFKTKIESGWSTTPHNSSVLHSSFCVYVCLARSCKRLNWVGELIFGNFSSIHDCAVFRLFCLKSISIE